MSEKVSKEDKKRKKRAPKVKPEAKAQVPEAPPPYPANQKPISMPPVDKKTVEGVEKLMEASYLSYLHQLKKNDDREDIVNMHHLNAILSEYVGPYMLIGYLPNDEPVEIFVAPTAKDREAILERLRKTFISHMNMNTPS